MTDPIFTLERGFDAPVDLVWRMWTEPEFVARWYGPGVKTKLHKFDPTPGGFWLNEMDIGGQAMFQKMEYTEVDAPNRLVMLMSNADATWNIVESPVMPNWPRTLLTTITLDAIGDVTRHVLTWEPYQPNPAEIATFAAAVSGLDKGWNAGMDIMADILVELQS